MGIFIRLRQFTKYCNKRRMEKVYEETLHTKLGFTKGLLVLPNIPEEELL